MRKVSELRKFKTDLTSLQNPLDYWVYLLKEAVNLKGKQMKTLQKKNPKIKKSFEQTQIYLSK